MSDPQSSGYPRFEPSDQAGWRPDEGENRRNPEAVSYQQPAAGSLGLPAYPGSSNDLSDYGAPQTPWTDYGQGRLSPDTNFYPGRQYRDGVPPLTQPHYGISFPGAIVRCLRKYARFDGRASRSEYWWWALAMGLAWLIIFGVAVIPLAVRPHRSPPDSLYGLLAVLMIIFLFGLIVPSIAICVRRLHDANLSGALWLLNLVPYIGGFVVLVLMTLPSRHPGARYDRVPESLR